MKYISFCAFLLLTSCTYTITLAHTEGQATDLIDETSSNEPNVSPDISLPIKAI